MTVTKKCILPTQELHLINSSNATAILLEDYTELTAMNTPYVSTGCK